MFVKLQAGMCLTCRNFAELAFVLQRVMEGIPIFFKEAMY